MDSGETPDMLSPTPDRLLPTPDMLLTTPDMLSPTPDRLSPTPDMLSPTLGRLSPTPDRLSPTPDRLSPTTDRLSPTADRLLPTPDRLLPTSDRLSPTPDRLSPTPDRLLQTSGRLSPTPDRLLPTSDRLSPTPERLLPTSDRLLPTPERLLPTPDRLLPDDSFLQPSGESYVPSAGEEKSPSSDEKDSDCSRLYPVFETDSGGTPDMLSPTPDRLSPTPDRLSPTPDRLSPTPDRLSPTSDRLLPIPDRLSPTSDRLSPTPDTLSPTPDMLSPTLDSLSPTPDRLLPTSDRLLPPPDRLLPSSDRLLPTPDRLLPVDSFLQPSGESYVPSAGEEKSPSSDVKDSDCSRLYPVFEMDSGGTPDMLLPTPDRLSPTPDMLLQTPDMLSPTRDRLSPTPDSLSPTPGRLSPTLDRLSPVDSGESYVPSSGEEKSTSSAEEDSDCSRLYPVFATPLLPATPTFVKSGKRKSQLQPTEMSPTVQVSSNTNEKRIWDKRSCCVYCNKMFMKLPRHFEQKHNQEMEVAKFLSCPKKSYQRKCLIKQLTNKGNFAHNINVISEQKGEIVPCKRPRQMDNMIVEAYRPCEHCLGFFVGTDLWKHYKTCHMKPSQENKLVNRNIQARSALLLPSSSSCNLKLQNVLQNMNDDQVLAAIRNDELILRYGEKLLKVGKEQHDRHFVSSKMRELGRFLLKIKAMKNDRTLTLNALIKPSQFSDIISSVKSLAGYDETSETYATPSLASKLGTALKKCAQIVKAEALMKDDDVARSQADKFYQLCEMEWCDQISSTASRNLREKKWNKKEMIPLVEDIVLLQKFLRQKASCLKKEIKEEATVKVWYELEKVALCQIILFNRRRSGEASRIKVESYLQMNNEVDEDILSSLTQLERQLCNNLHRFVIRGKRGNKVPVLLTNEMKATVDCLVENRCAEIPPTNGYLFAIPNSENYVRGSDCLRKFAFESGTKFPNRITSTKLRKHIATLSQLFNLQENELDILANFMGHNIKVHREYYRLPEDTIQLAKVSKILIALEQGKIKKIQGKTLDEMETDLNEADIDDEDDEEGDNEVVTSEEEDNQEVDDEEERDHDSDYDMVPLKAELKSSSTRGSKKKSTPWSMRERAAIKEELNSHFKLFKVPGKLECDECLRKHPVLSRRSWLDIKNFVHNSLQTTRRQIKRKNP